MYCAYAIILCAALWAAGLGSIPQSVSTTTESWGSDNSNFVNSTNSWVIRGGNSNNSSNAGLFYSNRNNGNANTNNGFRPSQRTSFFRGTVTIHGFEPPA